MGLGPTNAYDLAGIAALLALAGGWLRGLWRASSVAERSAAKVIADREQRYVSKVEERIAELDKRLGTMERAYGLVVGIAHVMVDDLIVIKPQTVSLRMVATRIRSAYPHPEDIPGEMLHLLHRLDTHLGGQDYQEAIKPEA